MFSGRAAQGSKTPVTGQLTPAQLLVKGGSGGKEEINVSMYMVDSTTGMVLASTNVTGKSTSSGVSIGYSGAGWSGEYDNFQKSNMGKAVQDAIAQGVQWMVVQLPRVSWRGEVVMIKDGTVYVNRGTREGVRTGQTFIVGKSDIIRDPGTGEVLDESVNEIARPQVTQAREKMSVCQVISGDAGAVSKGMMIQLP